MVAVFNQQTIFPNSINSLFDGNCDIPEAEVTPTGLEPVLPA